MVFYSKVRESSIASNAWSLPFTWSTEFCNQHWLFYLHKTWTILSKSKRQFYSWDDSIRSRIRDSVTRRRPCRRASRAPAWTSECRPCSASAARWPAVCAAWPSRRSSWWKTGVSASSPRLWRNKYSNWLDGTTIIVVTGLNITVIIVEVGTNGDGPLL